MAFPKQGGASPPDSHSPKLLLLQEGQWESKGTPLGWVNPPPSGGGLSLALPSAWLGDSTGSMGPQLKPSGPLPHPWAGKKTPG